MSVLKKITRQKLTQMLMMMTPAKSKLRNSERMEYGQNSVWVFFQKLFPNWVLVDPSQAVGYQHGVIVYCYCQCHGQRDKLW